MSNIKKIHMLSNLCGYGYGQNQFTFINISTFLCVYQLKEFGRGLVCEVRSLLKVSLFIDRCGWLSWEINIYWLAWYSAVAFVELHLQTDFFISIHMANDWFQLFHLASSSGNSFMFHCIFQLHPAFLNTFWVLLFDCWVHSERRLQCYRVDQRHRNGSKPGTEKCRPSCSESSASNR